MGGWIPSDYQKSMRAIHERDKRIAALQRRVEALEAWIRERDATFASNEDPR